MKVLYHSIETIDCTADPHEVSYKERQKMLDDVLKVLESDFVNAITGISVYGNEVDGWEELYDSDSYVTWDVKRDDDKPGEKASGQYAEKHKVSGLFYYSEANESDKCKKLPIGLSGYKKVMELIKNGTLKCEDYDHISIGVVWKFSMDHSCSDYITIKHKTMIVDYSNQDDYIGIDGYEKHCKELGNFLGVTILPA